MSESTRRGQADHRAVEVFERCAQMAKANGRTVEQTEKLIRAAVLADAARRFWERRGYAMPTDHDATHPAGRVELPGTSPSLTESDLT